jgi:hypothetical protein
MYTYTQRTQMQQMRLQEQNRHGGGQFGNGQMGAGAAGIPITRDLARSLALAQALASNHLTRLTK